MYYPLAANVTITRRSARVAQPRRSDDRRSHWQSSIAAGSSAGTHLENHQTIHSLAPGGTAENAGVVGPNNIYWTGMASLILEVYMHFLPAYQR